MSQSCWAASPVMSSSTTAGLCSLTTTMCIFARCSRKSAMPMDPEGITRDCMMTPNWSRHLSSHPATVEFSNRCEDVWVWLNTGKARSEGSFSPFFNFFHYCFSLIMMMIILIVLVRWHGNFVLRNLISFFFFAFFDKCSSIFFSTLSRFLWFDKISTLHFYFLKDF